MSNAMVDEAQTVSVPSTTVQEPTQVAEAAPDASVDDAPAPEIKNGDDGTEKKDRRVQRYYEDGMLKTSARERYGTERKKNSKYDPSVLPETGDHKLIRNQVEFYFGDSNLPQDKHMWNLTDGTSNHPVKIEEIMSFGRMKRFSPLSAVVAALRKSEFLEITGPEGLEEVKRRVAYDPTIPRAKSESRSIYAKGFGDEQASSQFDIEAFFSPYGPLNQVRLRRTDEKLFKGSVFVEFQDDETAAAFLALETKPLWMGKHTLKIMPKRQYQDEKEQEIKDGKIEPGPSFSRGRGRGRGGRGGNRDRNGGDRRGGRDRGDRDPDDWKKRREDDRANGYRDHHKNGHGRGRGRRDDRGPRNNDRNRDREGRGENGDSEQKAESKADAPPDAPVDEAKGENKKRGHDNDGEDGGPTKKVDSKADHTEEAKVDNAKKRTHDGEAEEGGPAKKVDSKSET